MVNKLAAFTRTKEFEQQLGQAFRDSKLLLRRWEIVELALRAHCQRTYLLSVPPLLAQVEGAVGDAVVLKGVARPIGGKLYQLDPSGNISKDRKGNDVEFKSVAALLKNAGFKHPIVLDVSTVISDRIIGERNAVLYGLRVITVCFSGGGAHAATNGSGCAL